MKTKDFFRHTARPLNIIILLCVLIFITLFFEMLSDNLFRLLAQQDTTNKTELAQSYFTIISPPLFYAGNKIIQNLPMNIETIFPNDKDGLIQSYVKLITNFYPGNLAICISLSIIMMLIAARHGWARKNNRFCFALWIIFVGLFNLAGLLTYLALNHTPTIKCPTCGKLRNLEKPECIRCRAKLPMPQIAIVK